MRSQQEQARAEQQRIKNLVLNYDLRDDDSNDGESSFHYIMQPNSNRTVLVGKGALNRSLQPRDSNNPVVANTPNTHESSSHGNVNTAHGLSLRTPLFPPSAITSSYACTRNNENTKPRSGISTTPADFSSSVPTAALDAQSPYNQPRLDKSGTSRNVTRSRKLQLSDVDWYAKPSSQPHALQKEKPKTELSLDSYIVASKKQRKPSKGPDALGNS